MENNEKTIKYFDLLIYQARNDNTKDFIFLISSDINYNKEIYKDFRVIKINVMPENSIYFTHKDYLFY